MVNYQTADGVELKSPYTDTPETVAEVVTEHYYVNADGEEVVVEDKTVKTPKNVAYNTKEDETEKSQKLTDAQGNVYYLNEANTTTSVNDTETTSPAEEGTAVEGVTKVTYIYEKAGSVIVNYKTEDGTPLTGTPNTSEKPMDPNSPAKLEAERSPVDVVKSQFKRLANTGNETTNTAAAGF